MTPPDVGDQLRLARLRVTTPHRSVRQWRVDLPHATAEQIRAGVDCNYPLYREEARQ